MTPVSTERVKAERPGWRDAKVSGWSCRGESHGLGAASGKWKRTIFPLANTCLKLICVLQVSQAALETRDVAQSAPPVNLSLSCSQRYSLSVPKEMLQKKQEISQLRISSFCRRTVVEISPYHSPIKVWRVRVSRRKMTILLAATEFCITAPWVVPRAP